MEKMKRGRPKGIKKDSRLYIMIPSTLKEEFQNIVEKEGSNISVKTCELISDYTKKNKFNMED